MEEKLQEIKGIATNVIEQNNNKKIMYERNNIEQKSVKKLETLIEKGDIDAINEMIKRYYKIRDYNRAIFYGEKLDNELLNSNFLLAICYFERAENDDYIKAYKIFSYLANEKNDDFAKSYLGKMYYLGLGIEKDFEKAYKYLIDGMIEDNYYIGRMFYYGEYVEKDINKAIEIFEKNIEETQYDDNSVIMLAHIYFKQGMYEKAFETCNKIIYNIDKNQINALQILGNLYENGLYVNKDINKAIDYYKRIIENSNNGCVLII